MHTQQCDRRFAIVKNNVVAGIERGQRAVGGISVFVLFEIARYGLPTTDVIPIKTRSAFSMIA